jgi:OOP family OmpA-OmpF porin
MCKSNQKNVIGDNIMKFQIKSVLLGCAFLFGCASPSKVELRSTIPKEAVNEIKELKHKLIKSNVDVLAKKSFEKGNDDLNDSIRGVKNKRSRDEIMSQLAQAKSHYLDAEEASTTRKVVPKSIMTARSGAINAGLLRSRKLRRELANLDDLLVDKSNNFSKRLSVDKLSSFQSKYLKLEVEAIKNIELGRFKKTLQQAIENDAEILAPDTLVETSSNGQIAENLINQSPRASKEYRASVDEANRSVKLLKDVVAKLRGDAKGASESVALKLVFQERRLNQYSDKVNDLEGTLTAKNSKMGDMSRELESDKKQILSDGNRIRFQNAMEKVGQSFSEDEASVYQQGEQLIIRLKKISFESGSARIPERSISLLSKVNSIVEELNPTEVVVEGHTDSTGKRKSNLALSKNRALAVKKYLASLSPKYLVGAHGFGESKPIANNETRDGRSLNRRVDLVIKTK